METASLIHPDYIRIIERKTGGWAIKHHKLFYRRVPIAIADMEDFQFMYGVSNQELTISLFRVNGGRSGFYVANLKAREYHYCGQQWEDIRDTLIEIGIGRRDPLDR